MLPNILKSASQQNNSSQNPEEQLKKARELFEKGMASVKDLIAPPALEIESDYLLLGEKYLKSFFVFAYPYAVSINWLSPLINLPANLDISMFIYPVDSRAVLENLKKRVAQMEATMALEAEKGQVRDPALEAACRDAEELRTKIVEGREKFFQYALYITIYADSKEELDSLAKEIESLLGGKLIYIKPAVLQMEQALNSTLPLGLDEVFIVHNFDTSSLATTFPFSTSELTSNEGILYGINKHNNTLVIFDRFSLENANSVVFAKAGAGKSYAVKLEAIRSTMLGTEVIIIDPEAEYRPLCEALGGSFINVSLTSNKRINPFDLPQVFEEEEIDALRSNIITLAGLLKVMLGQITPEEEAILDKALIETYSLKDITSDPSTWGNKPPLMEDLYNVLLNMRGAESLALRLEKYIKGSFAGIFNQPTNVDLDNQLVVFSIRDLEDQLRPIAMYIITNYIWNRVKSELKKRILIIDEAWTLMRYEDSARFVFSIAKRARKYYLGLTTITQEIEDFLNSEWGVAVVNNSSLQLLLKQSPAAIDKVAEVFKLTEGEKMLLLEAPVGEGLFFAGQAHVYLQIYSFYIEDQLITTSPKQLLEIEAAKKALEAGPATPEAVEKKTPIPQEEAPPKPESSPAKEQSKEANKEAPLEGLPGKEDSQKPVEEKKENLTPKETKASEILEPGKVIKIKASEIEKSEQ